MADSPPHAVKPSVGERVLASTAALRQGLFPSAKRIKRRPATTKEIITMQEASTVSIGSAGRQESAVHHGINISRAASQTISAVGVQYLVRLGAFFFVCDYDEDAELSVNELQVLMDILIEGNSRTKQQENRRVKRHVGERKDALVAFNAVDDLEGDSITLPEFIDRYGYRLFHDGVPLPPEDFVLRCRRLKVGFRRCDADGDRGMSIVELEIALQKLDVHVDDNDLRNLAQTLDSNGDGSIEWSEIVRAAWANTRLGPPKNRASVLLLDALADVPAPAIMRSPRSPRSQHNGMIEGPGHHNEAKPSLLTRLALRSHLLWQQEARSSQSALVGAPKSRVEQFGAQILTSISKHQVESMKRAGSEHSKVYPSGSSTGSSGRLGKGPHTHTITPVGPTVNTRRKSSTLGRTKLTSSMRHQVRRLKWTAITIAALAGVACGLISMKIEASIPRMSNRDEFTGDATYYVYLIAISLVVSLLEVFIMYLTSVVCAFRMTVATRLTLYPQDAEREFLARAIARAALQVGHAKDALFGLDPMKGSPQLVILFSFLAFKSKRYVLKFLIKLFIRRVLWRAAAKATLSVVVLPVNAVLNAWTLQNVMRNCCVTIIGPPCITALLEQFFAKHNRVLQRHQRVDYLRVLGCVLVSKRCVHPNLEIMIEQCRRRWVSEDAWPIVDDCTCLVNPDKQCTVHQLDDVDRMLASLLLYSSRRREGGSSNSLTIEHERNMLFLLVLGLICTGSLSLTDRRLYVRACQSASIVADWKSVRRLKRDFMCGYGVPMESITDIIRARKHQDPQDRDQLCRESVDSVGDRMQHWGDRLSSMLSI